MKKKIKNETLSYQYFQGAYTARTTLLFDIKDKKYVKKFAENELYRHAFDLFLNKVIDDLIKNKIKLSILIKLT